MRSMQRTIVAMAICASSSLSLSAQVGTLDTSFDTDGKLLTNFGTVQASSSGRGVVVQSSGRVVVGGGSTDGTFKHFTVVGLTPDGSLDASFGENAGYTRVFIAGNETVGQINSIALAPDQKIVAAGYTNSSTQERFAIARFLANGFPDPAFGTNGVVALAVSGPDGGNSQDRGMGVAVQPDGKIVVVGFGRPSTSGVLFDLVMVRLLTNGQLDPNFGVGGKVIVDDGAKERGWCVTIATNGNIYVGGAYGPNNGADTGTLMATFNSSGTRTNLIKTGFAGQPGLRGITLDDVDSNGSQEVLAGGFAPNGFLVMRYTAAGALDTTFGGGTGYIVRGVVSGDTGEAIQVRNHKIITGGWAGGDFAVLQFNANGTNDNTFSGDGLDILDFGSSSDYMQDITLQPDGKIIAVGDANESASSQTVVMKVVRWKTDGVLDTGAFATPNGYFSAGTITGGTFDQGQAITVDANNQPIVAGNSGGGAAVDFALTRYTTAGALDNTFSGDGRQIVDFGGSDYSYAVLENGGSIYAGGEYVFANGSSWALAKLNASGVLDTGFDGDGKKTISFGSNGGRIYSLARQTNGMIIAAGYWAFNSGSSSFALARFNSSGVLDTTFSGDGLHTFNTGTYAEARSVIIDSAGKIVIAGRTTSGNDSLFAIARLNNDGSLDTSFNGTGFRTFLIGNVVPHGDEAWAVRQDLDGRYVIAGKSLSAAGHNAFAVARVNNDGAMDTNFGTNGAKVINFGGDNTDWITSLQLQFDDKIVAFGSSQVLLVELPNFGIARYNWDDGTLDTTFDTDGKVLTDFGNDNGNGSFLFNGGANSGKFFMAGVEFNKGDFAVTKYLGDAAPTVPQSLALAAASDTGRFNNDKITKDNTPTFNGTCTIGNTVSLKRNDADSSPRSRFICRNGSFAVTSAVVVPDGTYSFTSYSATGAGASANSNIVASVVIDTVAASVTIAAPLQNEDVGLNPTISGAGAEVNAEVVVVVNGSTLCTLFANASGQWTCPTTLSIGSYTASVVQTDLAGNSSIATTRPFRVKAPTTTTTSVGVNPTVFGQAATFTATVTSPVPTPDGSVAFVIDGGAPTNVALVSGVASLVRSNLAVGSHTIHVDYLGSNSYFTSNDDLDAPHVVNKAESSIGITSSVNPSKFGQNVVFTVTATADLPGAGTPTGSVDVSIDGGTPTTVTLTNGSGTLSSAALTVGEHSFAGTYGGDGNFNPSSDSTFKQTVVKAGSATTLLSSLNPSAYGDTVTFTANVAAVSPGAGSASGSVEFFADGNSLGVVSLASGSAAISTSALTSGTRAMSAVYGGDGNFVTSTGTLNQTVTKPATLTSLVSSSSPSTYTGSVTFTATVTAPSVTGTPTGTVSFVIDAQAPVVVTMTNGVAALTTSTLAAGSHTVVATYGGDTNFNGSNGNLTQVVQKAGSTTAFSSSANPSSFGQSVTLTATVSAAATATGTPTGNVTFTIDANLVATVALVNGAATHTVSSLSVAGHPVDLAYIGDTNYNASQIAATQTVAKSGALVSVVSSANPSNPGDTVTLTVTVSAVAPGAGTPSGNVTLSEGANVLQSGPVDPSGVVSFSSSTLSSGAHLLTLTYAGDGNFNAASTNFSQNVNCSVSSATIQVDGLTNFCSGESVQLSAPAGVSYLWSNGETTRTILAAVSGSYSVAVTDVNGCTSSTAAVVVVANTPTLGASTEGDCNCDGKPDLFWRNSSTGEVNAWVMNGAMYSFGASFVPVADPNWKLAGSADFNGDFRTDLLWRNEVSGEVTIWLMSGYKLIGSAILPNVSDAAWKIEAIADFNNDGKVDIVWRNASNGKVNFWFMNGPTYVSGATYHTVPDLAWLIVGAGDFNADGKSDLVWRNDSTGAIAIWYMNGTAYVSGTTLSISVASPNWRIEAVADYNADGEPDLIWRNVTSGLVNGWLIKNSEYFAGVEIGSALPATWTIGGPK